MRSPLVISLASCVLLAVCQTVWSQDIQLARQQGPYYVGQPVVVQVSVSGANGDQDVSCSYQGDETEGLRITGPEVGRSTSTFMRSINGRITRGETVDYRFSFRLNASQTGLYELGPFVVTIDGEENTVQGPAFEFEELEADPDMLLELLIEDENIYVGELVPIRLRWSYSGDLDELDHVFSSLRLSSVLFDQFEFQDEPVGRSNTLSIVSASGDVQIAATARKLDSDGKPMIQVTGTRRLIAESPGEFRDVQLSASTIRVTSWGRNIFGDVRPRSTKPAMATSEPVSLTIRPLPEAGRPASFTGAVGKGFSIDVSANRSVVRVGDPIALEVTLRGQGNLEKLSLPNFSGKDMLDEKSFQLPGEVPPGRFAGTTKQFKINLRVRDQAVTQIPALPFSWFDPETEQYQTAYSKPVAVQVMEAQVISATDVIASQPATPKSPSTARERPVASGPELTLANANLAIERNTSILLARVGNQGALHWIAWSAYGLGGMAVVLAFLARASQNRDVQSLTFKKNVREVRKRIAQAEQLPLREAATQVAAALRELLPAASERDESVRRHIEEIIAECEGHEYAPTGADSAGQVSQLCQRASETIQHLTGPQS